MRLACDTGGTFTDLVVEDDRHQLHMFKAATTPNDPVIGVLDACKSAAAAFDLPFTDFLQRSAVFIHGTTHAINAIVTRRTARTALLVTEGHPDILVLREGGRAEPFNFRAVYPEPYIPRALTFEIPERIMADGSVRKPLDEAEVIKLAERLKVKRVEAIAVCFLWAIVNPIHELRVGELLRKHLAGVPVTLAHQLNPSLREYRRTIATSIDASLKPLMAQYIGGMAEALRRHGFTGRLLILTSQGGMVDAGEVARAPILAINSGPSMGPVAGRHFATIECREKDAIIFDTGGTTFDVSLIRAGRIPITHETWVGRPYKSDLTGFPSVDVRSVGAGGGSIAWVDDGGVLHVGPQSAGAVPGPACYGSGGQSPTVTDAALILGYLDPNYFLGGRICLDRAAAAMAIRTQVAEKLNFPLEDAAASIMEIATENMVQAIVEITVNQGIDPAQAALIGGGGAAGLNACAIAQRLNCSTLVIPESGPAMSAVGAIMSDLTREFHRTFVTNSLAFNRGGAAQTLEILDRACHEFINAAGAHDDGSSIEYSIEARYPHQVWEIDVVFEPDELMAPKGIERFVENFHKTHEAIFAFADRESHVELIGWRATVRCRLADRPNLRLGGDTTRGRPGKRQRRRVYFAGAGNVECPVYRFDDSPDHESIGPAVVESEFTTVVIDPGMRFYRSGSGNLIVTTRHAEVRHE